jgi:hypothetical protein
VKNVHIHCLHTVLEILYSISQLLQKHVIVENAITHVVGYV